MVGRDISERMNRWVREAEGLLGKQDKKAFPHIKFFHVKDPNGVSIQFVENM